MRARRNAAEDNLWRRRWVSKYGGAAAALLAGHLHVRLNTDDGVTIVTGTCAVALEEGRCQKISSIRGFTLTREISDKLIFLKSFLCECRVFRVRIVVTNGKSSVTTWGNSW